MTKNTPANAEDTGDTGLCVSLGWEISLEQEMIIHTVFCLENLMDREAWWALVYGVAKSQT